MTDAGPAWLCATCGVEYPSGAQPETCPICTDERQYVRPSGQRWTTLAELDDGERRGSVRELEPGLYGITVQPQVGIGQQAILVRTDGGNLLWDPVGYLDDALAADVAALGGVAAIAASHPHMFGVQVEWSRRFDGAPVLINRAGIPGQRGGAPGRGRRAQLASVGQVEPCSALHDERVDPSARQLNPDA